MNENEEKKKFIFTPHSLSLSFSHSLTCSFPPRNIHSHWHRSAIFPNNKTPRVSERESERVREKKYERGKKIPGEKKELKNNFIEMWSSKTTTITSPVIYQSIFR
jgi:hypothetical protein